jgi:lipopolysaccharide/colanic/teichoic acid biosynthesis glycosyltransferase
MNTLKTVLIVEDEPMTRKMLEYILGKNYHVVVRDNVKEALWCLKTNPHIDCILSDLYMPDMDGKEFIRQVRQHPQYAHIPFILLSGAQESNVRINCLEMGADDFITKPFNPKEVQLKIEAILRRSGSAVNLQEEVSVKSTQTLTPVPQYLPWWKRLLDIVVSGTALLLLSPLLLVVGLLIKMDSKGPIVYKSKRVGAKYRIFDLYKFRSMRTDADQLLDKMAGLNMYNQSATPTEIVPDLCAMCQRKGSCQHQLFKDGRMICESNYLATVEQDAAFKKFQNDPRVTRLGSFLRNSSIDELPQLWNIFIGDMSLVGNRPLPLYEAEKLTTDAAIGRFDAPAGLTGLWQVTKRGKGKKDMSAAERIQLDIQYAQQLSAKMDWKIILKTFPALLQSENV